MAVEQDEKLMESYLNGDEIKEEDLIKCIRKGTLNFSFVPILTGSAFKNKGVQPLLDAVINYLRNEAILRTAFKNGWWDNFEVPLRKQIDWVGRFLNAKLREKKMTVNGFMRMWGRDKWLLSFLSPERYLEFVKNKKLRWGDWNTAYRNARTFYFRQRDEKKRIRQLKKVDKAIKDMTK